MGSFAVMRRPTRAMGKAFICNFLEAFRDYPAIADEFFHLLRQVAICIESDSIESDSQQVREARGGREGGE